MATKANPVTLGNYLRELRTERNLSLKDLATALQVDQSLISKIEHGERSLSLDMIPALAVALNTDFKALQIDLMALRLAEDFGKEEYATEALKQVIEKLQKQK